MWFLFKDCLVDGVVQYILKISQFSDWHKLSWRRPSSTDIKANIKNKHMLWKQYLVT